MTDYNNVIGIMDARCSKCGRRIGWHGKLSDRPECPRCKHTDTVNLSAEAKALLDGECFGMTQTLLYEYKDQLADSEKLFVLNMYKKRKGRESYSDTQISNIKRIYEKLTKFDAPESLRINETKVEGSLATP